MMGRRPDWQALMAEAPALPLEAPPLETQALETPSPDAETGYVYLVADAHLGDARAPVPPFLEMLRGLERPALVVLLGDLFKVWLALPKFWDARVRSLIEGLHALRRDGTPVWMVVGNRDFFLPRGPARLAASGLPFDVVLHDAGVLEWRGRSYALTHGDLANREDAQYLRWRRLARSRPFEALFRAMPGPVARRVAERLEAALANTNQEIKIAYPADELEAFTAAVLGHPRGVDAAFIGHFHRDAALALPGHPGSLRIVPDWFGTRSILRLAPDGQVDTLTF